MITGSMERLKKIPLFNTLFSLSGNSRACVYTEPLFTIPFYMITPFATLYMYRLGLDDIKIGLIVSIGLFIQLITAFIGGTLTDVIGRRKLTLITDLFSWALPCLIWTFSQNFWWFMAAAVFNAFMQISNVSWSCLLVEDSETDRLEGIYTWIFIMGMVSGLFVPLGGLLVGRLSLVTAMRIMYFAFFVSMAVKAFLLYGYSTETKRGLIRMQETKGRPVWGMMSENYQIIKLIFKSRKMSDTLVVMVMTNIASTVSTTFYSLLATESLSIPESLLGYFQIIRTVCMLIFIFFFQNALSRLNIKFPLIIGILIHIAGQIFLATAQYGRVIFILAFLVCDAFAVSIVVPRKDTLVAANIKSEERARIMGIMTSIMLGLSIPFGYIAGVLSAQNRIYPFLMNAVIYILLIYLIIVSKNLFKVNLDNNVNGG